MRKERGITLVALVITIIVLLILAGVTINLTLGERGIFSIAKKAAQESEIAEYLDKVELARVEVASKNMGKVTIEELVAQIYKDKVVSDGSITIVEDYAVMVTPEEYTILITTEKSEYVPGGKIEAPGDINDYIETGDITVEQTPGSETYTKESVKITITTKIENQKIQYSIDNGRTYKDYTGAFNVYENKTIYIVLRNALGEIGASYGHNITNIDTEAPVITKVEATATTITFSAKDNLSGIIGYKVTESGTEPTEFDEIESTTSIENKVVSVEKQNTDYYVWVKDEAGNVSACSTTKTTTQPVTSITIAPTSATIKPGETVDLTATINPSNAFNKTITWGTGDSAIATVNNGTVTGVAAGTTMITATAQDGSNVKGSCSITVVTPTLVSIAEPGDYVEYDGGNGYTGQWQVLYNDSTYGLQIISSALVNESYTLGGSTEVATKESYNNAVNTLNNECRKFVNSPYATSGRCVGSNPLSPDDNPTTMDKVTLQFTYKGSTASGCVVADSNYKTDYNAMKVATKRNTSGIHNLGKKYWLASRYMESDSNRAFFTMSIVKSSGDWYIGDYFWRVEPVGALDPASRSYGLRPVITLKSDIQTISGDGSESTPFKLVAQ